MPGRVASLTYLGSTTRYGIALDGGGMLTVVRQNSGNGGALSVGEAVGLSWPRSLMQMLKKGV